jgi:serine/threonine protein kinase
MRKLPTKAPTPLTLQFPNTPLDALDLMRKMLEIHPHRRINVEDALSHPFLSQLHSPEDEPVADAVFDFSFEKEKLNRLVSPGCPKERRGIAPEEGSIKKTYSYTS